MTGMSTSLAFFMPAHNEGLNLPNMVGKAVEYLKNHLQEYVVIIVNDGSDDNTVEVFAELRRQYGDAVDMVTHEQNIGYGGALRSGLLAGVETGYDFVAFCDGDGQFDPSEVGKLLDCALLGKLDVVVGYREARADNLVRQMLGKTWHTMQDHLLERTDAIRDVDCGFKLFRREALQRFVQDLAETQAAISPEIMVYVDQHDLRIDEVGVWHGPRLAGKQSGGNPLVAVRSVIGLLRVRRIASATQATQKEMS